MKRVRVLIVDDSLFMRAAIKKILAADPRIEVVGEAEDGADAVTRAAALRGSPQPRSPAPHPPP